MTALTIPQAYGFARQAGFSPPAAMIVVSIGMAESGLQPHGPDGLNHDSAGNVTSRDRGWLQINDVAHPDVPDAVAYDPLGAAVASYRISGGGTNFKPWTTYTHGTYAGNLPAVQAALGPDAPTVDPSTLSLASNTVSLTGGVQTAGSIHGWNPFAWPGQLVSDAFSGVAKDLYPLMLRGLFLIGGIGIAALGVKRLTDPYRRSPASAPVPMPVPAEAAAL